jgi:hypothetical protein
MWKPEIDVTWKLYYKPVKACVDTCVERAIKSKMPELVEVIRHMACNWENVQVFEGIEEWPS